MTPSPERMKLRQGQVLQLLDERYIVLKVGRGMTRSAVLFVASSGKWRLFTEIDYWFPQWNAKVISHKPTNTKFAKAYLQSRQDVPEV